MNANQDEQQVAQEDTAAYEEAITQSDTYDLGDEVKEIPLRSLSFV